MEFKIVANGYDDSQMRKWERYLAICKRNAECMLKNRDMDTAEIKRLLKQIICAGVRYVGQLLDYIEHQPIEVKSKIVSKEGTEEMFTFIQMVFASMASLTPRELINLFPPTKEYDGEKYFIKDYFSTMEAVNKYEPDKPLGEDNIRELLWNYMNPDLFEFLSAMLTVVSYMRQLNGEKGIMEQFCEDNGIDTYSGDVERGYITNNSTGEIISTRNKPRFEVVK